jgi:hypothetical protein
MQPNLIINGSRDGFSAEGGELHFEDKTNSSVRENMILANSAIQSPSVLRRNQINFISQNQPLTS